MILTSALLLATPSPAPGLAPALQDVQVSHSNGTVDGVFPSFGYEFDLGRDLAVLGDVDGDGTTDLGIILAEKGSTSLDDYLNRFIVALLRPDGSVKSYVMSSAPDGITPGGWVGAGDLDGDGRLEAWTTYFADPGPSIDVALAEVRADGLVESHQPQFDLSVHTNADTEVLGDLDGNGVEDLVLGFPDEDRVRIVLLEPDLSPKATQAIGQGVGGFVGAVPTGFGIDVAALGDIDGDGAADLAVGRGGPSFFSGSECAWVLRLNPDGTVKGQVLLGSGLGGLPTFGMSAVRDLEGLGDLNGDGVPDLLMSISIDGEERILLLFLSPDGTVASFRELTSGGAIPGSRGLDAELLGDLDGDGDPELAVHGRVVGTGPSDDLIQILSLAPDGAVVAHTDISPQAGLAGLRDGDELGSAAAVLLHGPESYANVVVGAPGTDDGGPDRGGLWVLHLDEEGLKAPSAFVTGGDIVKYSSSTGVVACSSQSRLVLQDADRYGAALATLELFSFCDPGLKRFTAVGAPGDDTGGADTGALHVSRADFNIFSAQHEVGSSTGGFGGSLQPGDAFGSALAPVGDLDGDSDDELAVGAPGDDDGGSGAGAVWVLFFSSASAVSGESKISSLNGAAGAVLSAGDAFGSSLVSPGDLNGDGTEDLLVGAPGSNGGEGAVWVLFLNADGSVSSSRRIASGESGLPAALGPSDSFGASLAFLESHDGAYCEVAVGAPGDGDGGPERGAVWSLVLGTDGSVVHARKHSSTVGRFDGALEDGDRFGASLVAIPDLTGDGRAELLVGVPGEDDGGTNRGGFWIARDMSLAPTAFSYGEPEGSLTLASGLPILGASLVLAIDNPFGSQSPGSLTFLSVSLAEGIGIQVPGWGMFFLPGLLPGELWIDLAPSNLVVDALPGTPYGGFGNPGTVTLALPNAPVLVGLPLFAQGAIVDLLGGNVGLTNGFGFEAAP